jgi:hypothetical protein
MNKNLGWLGGAVAAWGLLAGSAAATTLINDTFSGSSVDSSIWSVGLPFANSSVSISGGDAIFKGRGTLVSVNPVIASPGLSLDIRGSFAFTGSVNDSLNIRLRSDGIVHDVWGNVGGVDVLIAMPRIVFNNYGVGGTWGGVAIDYASPLQVNTYYDFRVTDDGQTVKLYIGDLVNPFSTFSSTYTPGDKLAICDRDENGTFDSVDNAGSQINLSYVQVNLVPEPGIASLLGVAAGCALLARRRNR